MTGTTEPTFLTETMAQLDAELAAPDMTPELAAVRIATYMQLLRARQAMIETEFIHRMVARGFLDAFPKVGP